MIVMLYSNEIGTRGLRFSEFLYLNVSSCFCLFAMDIHDDARKEQSDLRRVQFLVQFIHEKIGCNNLLLVVDQLRVTSFKVLLMQKQVSGFR